MDDKDLAARAFAIGFDLDKKYGCCPQCVLTALKQTVGGISDETIKASHGLSGGGSLMGTGTCGALSGGLVAIGTRSGRDADKLDKGRGMANFQKGKVLTERFEKEYGGITCQHLQQRFTGRTWDFWKPDEYKAFSAARGDQCARATGLVTQWVVELL